MWPEICLTNIENVRETGGLWPVICRASRTNACGLNTDLVRKAQVARTKCAPNAHQTPTFAHPLAYVRRGLHQGALDRITLLTSITVQSILLMPHTTSTSRTGEGQQLLFYRAWVAGSLFLRFPYTPPIVYIWGMRLRFIKPGTRDRIMVRMSSVNLPAACATQKFVVDQGYEQVGLVKFLLHLVFGRRKKS